jgi:nucleotide-binding universal stress UspA family protein
MKTILVPTDFSPQAENAMDFAIQMSKMGLSSVMLLNVIEHPTSDTFNTMGIVQSGYNPMENLYILKMMESAKAKMEAIMANPDYKEVKVKYKILIGNPYKEISREIAEMAADIVVMGTEGTTGFTESLMGSNVERVVRNANCPVISVKDKATVKKIKDIAFASDFVDVDKDLIKNLKYLQSFFDAKLRLVRINTPNSFTSSRHDDGLMKAFVKDFDIKNYTTEVYNASLEEEGIIYYADDINADMIAIGTHGRTGLIGLISGSIAEDIANHASRPVWTFKIKK